MSHLIAYIDPTQGNDSVFYASMSNKKPYDFDAFEGEALTAKVITDNTTRETDDIHQYIAAMTSVDPIA